MNIRPIRFIAAAALFAPLLAFGQKNSCVECHSQLEDELKAPVAAVAADVHSEYGLSCAGCHGGNPSQDDVGLAKDKSFRGAPKRSQIPVFCGGCHADAAAMRTFNPALRTDQLSQYATSRHGQLLKSGDSKAAVCTDCHGVHGIQSARFPKSMTFPWNIPQTCGQCHPSTGELFTKSPHKKAFDELGAGECEACHGNHKILTPSTAMIGTDDKAVCVQCHEKGSRGFEAAAELRREIDGFDGGFRAAAGLLSLAKQKGVEVRDAEFKLQDVNTILVTAKNMTHGLDTAELAKTVAEGEELLAGVRAAGQTALDGGRFRRRGLAGANS